GPRKQKNGLRLDNGEEAFKGGNSGAVIKPKDAIGSRLFQVLAGTDPEVKMPPKGEPPLLAGELGRIRAWNEQGAHWPKDAVTATVRPASTHWAFVAPKRTAPPEVATRGWVRTDIDRFILSRLEAEKIAPSSEADKVTLIRRLSLDLLGLPP